MLRTIGDPVSLWESLLPAEVLRPSATWKNQAEYDAQARRLAGLVRENFRQYEAQAPEAVRQAGPRV